MCLNYISQPGVFNCFFVVTVSLQTDFWNPILISGHHLSFFKLLIISKLTLFIMSWSLVNPFFICMPCFAPSWLWVSCLGHWLSYIFFLAPVSLQADCEYHILVTGHHLSFFVAPVPVQADCWYPVWITGHYLQCGW